MRLVAVAALVLAVLGHVRVALQIGGGLDQVVASHVVAGLVQAELIGLDAAGGHEILQGLLGHDLLAGLGVQNLVAAGDPAHALADLLGQGGNMATEAGGAVLGAMHSGHHAGGVGDLVAPHVSGGLAGLGLIGGQVGVHRGVADGVAEARLLVPYPEAGAGHDEHSDDDAHDDGPLLLFLLGGRLGSLPVHLFLFFCHASSFQLGILEMPLWHLLPSKRAICPPQLTSEPRGARAAPFEARRHRPLGFRFAVHDT